MMGDPFKFCVEHDPPYALVGLLIDADPGAMT